MTGGPLVSICIPVYNHKEYICQAIESALSQDYSNMEIIVLDNRSDDGTWEKIRKYGRHDRVRILRNESTLFSVDNWNRCASHATGDYIKFLFADDIIYHDCITEMMNIATGSNDVGFVFSARDILISSSLESALEVKRAEWILGLNAVQKRIGTGVYEGRVLLNLVFPNVINYIGEPSNTLIKRALFMESGGFDARFQNMVDLELWIRILSIARVGYVNKNLSICRIHPAQAYLTEMKKLDRRTQEKLALFVKHREVLSRLLDAELLQEFAWKNLILSYVALKRGHEVVPPGDIDSIRRELLAIQGGFPGLAAHLARYLLKRFAGRDGRG